MNLYSQKDMLDYDVETPLRTICGFKVRPGMFDINGAMALRNGVNFTIHTHYGTACELLLFHRQQEDPFAVLPFPEDYKIGDVYSMIVFDLDIEEIEYAYRVDGPYRPEEGLLFDRKNVLLDPYARAVAGQKIWGKTRQGACSGIYQTSLLRRKMGRYLCRVKGKDPLFKGSWH